MGGRVDVPGLSSGPGATGLRASMAGEYMVINRQGVVSSKEYSMVYGVFKVKSRFFLYFFEPRKLIDSTPASSVFSVSVAQ